jgi:hypothetical protein
VKWQTLELDDQSYAVLWSSKKLLVAEMQVLHSSSQLYNQPI